MTERPSIHKKTYKDVKTNFIFQDEIAKILFKILTFKGILNLGGKSQSVYNFARCSISRYSTELMRQSNIALIIFSR